MTFSERSGSGAGGRATAVVVVAAGIVIAVLFVAGFAASKRTLHVSGVVEGALFGAVAGGVGGALWGFFRFAVRSCVAGSTLSVDAGRIIHDIEGGERLSIPVCVVERHGFVDEGGVRGIGVAVAPGTEDRIDAPGTTARRKMDEFLRRVGYHFVLPGFTRDAYARFAAAVEPATVVFAERAADGAVACPRCGNGTRPRQDITRAACSGCNAVLEIG